MNCFCDSALENVKGTACDVKNQELRSRLAQVFKSNLPDGHGLDFLSTQSRMTIRPDKAFGCCSSG